MNSESIHVKVHRKCCSVERRDIPRNGDKSNCLPKPALPRQRTLSARHPEGPCSGTLSDGGRRPVTLDVEQLIRQTLLASGWTQEPVFDDYTEGVPAVMNRDLYEHRGKQKTRTEGVSKYSFGTPS